MKIDETAKLRDEPDNGEDQSVPVARAGFTAVLVGSISNLKAVFAKPHRPEKASKSKSKLL